MSVSGTGNNYERDQRLLGIDKNEFDFQVLKLLNNPEELTVEDYPNWCKPRIGDLVEIVSWDTQENVQECVRLAKLPYLTVKRVIPYIVGCGDERYCWAYQIGVEESHLKFLQWHYKVIKAL